MLLSMTGFGEAHCQQDGLAVGFEIRTINSRFFKLVIRTSEGYGSLEPRIEKAVRSCVHRGTVQVGLRVERARLPEQYKINTGVLDRYRLQLESLYQQWNLGGEVNLNTLLALPGVIDDTTGDRVDADADWPVVARTLEAALESLGQMRVDEGLAMATALKTNCATVAKNLTQIEQRAPLVVEAYRQRLHERLKKTLAEFDIALDPADVIKEVSLFADRGDISEETVRLRSHLEQFGTIMELPESSGRKLEFLTQEMLRETNTIGAKGNDVDIARYVIEIKATLERIREMIQNVE